jgi:acyl carrier protein
MIGLWEHGLGVEGLGIDDNFFELGGHSLLLTQLVARVRKQLGLRLPLEKAFELATVRHWAKLAERSSEADDQPIRRVDRSKYRSAASVLQRLG